MFEYIKLNIKVLLFCIECKHSCAIVCTLVKLSLMFAIIIELLNTRYKLVLILFSSFIITFSFFNFCKIVLHISLFSGSLFVISFKLLSYPISFSLFISLIFILYSRFSFPNAFLIFQSGTDAFWSSYRS